LAAAVGTAITGSLSLMGADVGAGGGECPRDCALCEPAADGPADCAELALGHDLTYQRQRVGLLMGEVDGQPRGGAAGGRRPW
jgi:hypothetical protein